MNNKILMTFTINSDVKKKLKTQAFKENCFMNDVIEKALLDYFDKHDNIEIIDDIEEGMKER